MEINTEKSKVMWISKQEKAEEELNIVGEGKILEKVNNYEYLGVITSSDGRIEQEISNRVIESYYSILWNEQYHYWKKRNKQ